MTFPATCAKVHLSPEAMQLINTLNAPDFCVAFKTKYSPIFQDYINFVKQKISGQENIQTKAIENFLRLFTTAINALETGAYSAPTDIAHFVFCAQQSSVSVSQALEKVIKMINLYQLPLPVFKAEFANNEAFQPLTALEIIYKPILDKIKAARPNIYESMQWKILPGLVEMEAQTGSLFANLLEAEQYRDKLLKQELSNVEIISARGTGRQIAYRIIIKNLDFILRSWDMPYQSVGDKIIETLINLSADIALPDQRYNTLLRGVAKIGLLNATNPTDRQTALHRAAQAGNIVKTQLLLEAGALFHLRDRENKTPYQLAAEAGKTDWQKYFRQLNV